MKYFGIKCPKDGRIWWIAEDSSRAWSQFFQHMPSRSPTSEAIKAYEAIGYRCVELTVKELEPSDETELDRVEAELAVVKSEREVFGSQLWELAQRERDCRVLLYEAHSRIKYDEDDGYKPAIWCGWLERADKLLGKRHG